MRRRMRRMLALTAAQQAVGDWRLEGCTLFVTKEACPMISGAESEYE